MGTLGRALAGSSQVGRPFAEAVETLLGAGVPIARHSERHTFKVILKR